MKTIKLTQNKIALVDDEDFEYLNQFKWLCANGYAIRKISINGKRKTIWMHRLIMNTPDDMQTDHIHHDPLDNRKENLRICTRQQNGMNRKSNKNSTSKYKGVSWKKREKKWQSYIQINGTSKHLGGFKSEEDAALSYNQAATKYFGEFALLNVIS